MELLGALAVLFIGALVIGTLVGVVAILGLVLKCLFWIVLLPFRLLFFVLLLPLLILKVVLGGVLLLAVGPIVVIAAAIGFVALVGALLAPLIPLAIVAGLVWLI